MTLFSQYSALSVVKSVSSYTLLPGFWSRFVGFMPRFGMIAYLMAVVFESIHLLPKGHQFQDAARMETYKIRDVMALAANNLHGGFRNSDQYIIFGMFLLGAILLILQFIFLFFMIATRAADAAIPFAGFFVTVNPETDIAHLMMDKVFGIPKFFNSCFDPSVGSASFCTDYPAQISFPDPFQQGMQALFSFYTFGMLTVAAFIVFYFIVAMILETVNTGVPFGKRFQSVFTPIRLVLAVLLLLPLAYGYNTGQYIVLLAAKYGSALATNSWLLFNSHAGDNPMGMTPRELIGKPKIGTIESVLNFMYLAQTCRASYEFGVPKSSSVTTIGSKKGVEIKPYLVRPATSQSPSTSMQLSEGVTYDVAQSFYGRGDVQIVFGEKNENNTQYHGLVKPYCGVILMPALSKKVPGIEDIYNIYFKNVLDIWFNSGVSRYGNRMACVLKFSSQTQNCPTSPPSVGVPWGAEDHEMAGQEFYMSMRNTVQSNFKQQLNSQIDKMRGTVNPAISMDVKTLLMGWGGAGVWFNKVMSFNGAMVDALSVLPTPTQYPMIMEHVAKKKKILSPNVPAKEVFSMTLKTGQKTLSMDQHMGDSSLGGSQSQNVEIAGVLSKTYSEIQETQGTSEPKVSNTDSPIKNFISLLFGQTGIFDFRANAEVFPLAKLAMLGRELIDKTVIMIASRAVMSGVGSAFGAELGPMGDVIKGLGPAFGTFATMGLSVGILLYYVVPLMPFIYFFFGVGRWVKSVFEAMVAVPLWALAHLRLGGEGSAGGGGIPGPSAIQGYFLILEIFLRPILTLFGLAASLGTFMALTIGMDSVFNLAVFNLGGFDMTTLSNAKVDGFANFARDGMDALFYTIIYAVLVYMMATTSFKLIDLIPNAIMRWGGTNIAGFNDGTAASASGDPVMGQINYQLVFRADTIAQKIDNQSKGIMDAGDNFNLIKTRRDNLKPT